MIWILLAFVSWVFVSISNVLTKKISVNWNIEKSLLFQYLLVCFLSFFFFIFDSYSIVYSNLFFILIIISWIFGYFLIWWLMNLFSKLQSWVNIIVSHMYVFLWYFVNYLIFPDIEWLSIIKILFAIMFFVIIY